jgi:hypothetical protein
MAERIRRLITVGDGVTLQLIGDDADFEDVIEAWGTERYYRIYSLRCINNSGSPHECWINTSRGAATFTIPAGQTQAASFAGGENRPTEEAIGFWLTRR